jgi:6-phosphogluconolactonase
MKKSISNSIVLLLILFLSACTEKSIEKEILYVASSEGLYVVEFNRSQKAFNLIQQVSDRTGSFQAIHPDGNFLYTISGKSVTPDNDYGSVAAYQIDQDTGMLSFINIRSAEGRGPAHVSIDPQGRFAYVSNYGEGNLSSYPIRDDGSLGEAVSVIQHEGSSINEQRQKKPYVHSAIPSEDGKFVYVSDLGIDKIMIYEVDQETGELSPAESPYVEIEPGSGPRHFTLHPQKDFAYSVDELSSTVTVLAFDSSTGALQLVQRVDMLPEDYDEASYSADIHISPDGRFLYASNRGHDSLAIYSIDTATGQIELLRHESTRGGHPRNFAVDTKGQYVFVTNRDDNNLVLFERDLDTGLLEYTGEEFEIPSAICVTQHFLY